MIKQQLQIIFERKLCSLSVRAKNILTTLRLLNFENFYNYFIEQQKYMDFQKVKNCGIGTAKQLNEFLEELFKESNDGNSSLEINTISPSSQHEEFKLTTKIKFEFQQQFASLNARTKNVLASIGADKPDIFFREVLSLNSLKKILDIENCGLKTYEEILSFRSSIFNLIDNKEYTQSKGFFNDLNFLFTENVLKAEESHVLKYHFGFVNPKKNQTLGEIAENFGLTKERIRQISIAVLDKIKKIAAGIFSNGNYNLLRYFPSNFFYASREFVFEINEVEETNFSLSFITYVLESVNHPEYDFVSINKEMKLYSGIFIKKIVQFDFQRCFQFLSQYLNTRRKEDVVVKIDDLINSFKLNPKGNFGSPSETKNLCDQRQILEVLNLYKESVWNKQNEIILNEDFISFKRNTKKLKYEFIFDILNEYKKPMHFTELYKECVKREITTTAFSIHGIMQRYPKVFGLKGPGIYGLLEWGGYFGSIGDVAEQLLKERNQPMDRKELVDILCRQLYITQVSINTVLFFYDHKKRFIKMKSHKIGLKEWLTVSKK